MYSYLKQTGLFMNLGKNIKELRIKAGLSQDEFAKLLKVQQPNVYRWECNVVTPSIQTVIKIAKTMNVSADNILFSASDRKKLETSNSGLAKRLKAIEKLDYKDQNTLFQLIDTYIKSKK